MDKVALLRFAIKPYSKLHSGYAQEFGKFVNKRTGKERKISRNLEMRNSDGELQPALLASSVKGVFRSASAWFVEKIARQLGSPDDQFITCDYLKVFEQYKNREIPPHSRFCPVCQVYGGSVCRVGEKARQRSKVNFSFLSEEASDSLYGRPHQRSSKYTFAWAQLANRRSEKPLEIEDLVSNEVFLLIRIQPATPLAISLICFTVDLISSGFFRIGRFTSRGYGALRLSPTNWWQGSPLELLDIAESDISEIFMQDFVIQATEESGFGLASSMLESDPLEILRSNISFYIGDDVREN